jgi:hypothetical protein
MSTNSSPERCSRSEKARRSGEALGLVAERIYDNCASMAKAEAVRANGIEAVAIVTPNYMHAEPAIAFLEAGIHVICDKPLTVSLLETRRMKAAVEKSGRIFALTHNYTGWLAPPRSECRAGRVLCSVFATSSYSQCEEGAIRQRDAADGNRVKKGGKEDVLSALRFDVRTPMSLSLSSI